MAPRTTLDDIRPRRRRTPYMRPHARTLMRVTHRPSGMSSRWVARTLIALLVVLIGAVYALLFWSPQFRVEQPVVNGTERITAAAVVELVTPLLSGLRWGLAPADALLAAPTSAIEEAIRDTYSGVESVSVHKELPNVLKIDVRERQPYAIWSAAGQFFFVDERGIAFDEIIRSESRDVSLPVVVDERNRTTIEQDRVMTEATLTFVRDVFEGITRETGVGINFFVAPSRLAPDLTLVTSDGWHVLFNTEEQAAVQIASLDEILRSQVTDRSNLEYIDLRIPGRVFLK